jgi:hypothetical protein
MAKGLVSDIFQLSFNFVALAVVAAFKSNQAVPKGLARCNRLAPEDLKSPFQQTNVLPKELMFLTLSAVLDMKYHEIRSAAGLSNADLMRVVNEIAGSVCMGIELDGLSSRCSQYFPRMQEADLERPDMFQLAADQIRLSSLIDCLNQTSPSLHDEREENHPQSNTYTIPNAAELFHPRNWVLSVISLKNFIGEQHYNQRRAFQELLFLMRRYGGDRGLVEPVFVYNPRNSSIYETLWAHDPETLSMLSPADATAGPILWNDSELHLTLGIFASPAGALLDMPTLSRALQSDILPYRSFRELSGQTLDELIITDSTLTGGSDQPELDCSREAETEGVKVELLGLQWNVSRFRCLADSCVEPSFGQAVTKNEAKTLGVAYARTRLCPTDASKPICQWHGPDFEYLVTRTFLRFSLDVVTTALDFIRAGFDGQPFIGIHWRRGDRLVFGRRDLSVDPETVVERAAEACAKLRLMDVYLMTNCGLEADVRFIVEQLRGVGISVRRWSGRFESWEEEDKKLAVETSIMSFAEFVLVSPSAVSGAVLEERVLLGWDPAMSWDHLPTRYDLAEEYENLVLSLLWEMEENPTLEDAVQSQEGLGRLVVQCLHQAPPAACAELVVNSSRYIAGRV